jgi:hypothetical protein
MNGRRGLIWLAIGLAVILVIVLAVRGVGDAAPTGRVDTQQLVYLLLVGLLVSGSAWAALRNNTAQALKYLAVWGLIGGLIALVYLVTH